MSYSAYDNNFGSNAADGWELSAQDLAVLASYVNRGGAEETSFDDIFDEPTYRAAQTTFAGQGHRMMPHGQTHYRPVVQHVEQGMPHHLSSAHWEHLPDSGTQKRPAMHSGSRLAWAVAQDSSRSETYGAPRNNFGSNPYTQHRPAPLQRPPARQVPAGTPTARTYHFAG